MDARQKDQMMMMTRRDAPLQWMIRGTMKGVIGVTVGMDARFKIQKEVWTISKLEATPTRKIQSYFLIFIIEDSKVRLDLNYWINKKEKKIYIYHWNISCRYGLQEVWWVCFLTDIPCLIYLSNHPLHHPKAQDKHPYKCVVSGDKKVCVCLNELDLGGVFFPEEDKPEILIDPCKKCG